eukprot:556174-Prorocentrum_lima.AAC.1
MPPGMPAMMPAPDPLVRSSAAAADLAPSSQRGRTRKSRPEDTGDRTLSPEEAAEAGRGESR